MLADWNMAEGFHTKSVTNFKLLINSMLSPWQKMVHNVAKNSSRKFQGHIEITGKLFMQKNCYQI